MMMLIRIGSLIIFGVYALDVMNFSFAQNEELKAGHVRAPVAMSKEVAREKLMTYGFTNIERLEREGDTFTVQGTRENQPVQMEMHAVTGVLRDKASKELVQPSSQIPLIQDNQIKIERQEVTKPELLPPQP
jgi:hypothetical protein